MIIKRSRVTSILYFFFFYRGLDIELIMFRKSTLLIFISVVFFLSACSPQTTPTPSENDLIPEAGQNTGVIYGYLFDQEKQPIQDSIYLSEDVAHDLPDLPPTISFSLQSSPRGRIDGETGFFYFDKVEPANNYVITIFMGAGEPYTVRGDNPEMPLFIEVKAGEQIDLGEIIVDIAQ